MEAELCRILKWVQQPEQKRNFPNSRPQINSPFPGKLISRVLCGKGRGAWSNHTPSKGNNTGFAMIHIPDLAALDISGVSQLWGRMNISERGPKALSAALPAFLPHKSPERRWKAWRFVDYNEASMICAPLNSLFSLFFPQLFLSGYCKASFSLPLLLLVIIKSPHCVSLPRLLIHNWRNKKMKKQLSLLRSHHKSCRKGQSDSAGPVLLFSCIQVEVSVIHHNPWKGGSDSSPLLLREAHHGRAHTWLESAMLGKKSHKGCYNWILLFIQASLVLGKHWESSWGLKRGLIMACLIMINPSGFSTSDLIFLHH